MTNKHAAPLCRDVPPRYKRHRTRLGLRIQVTLESFSFEKYRPETAHRIISSAVHEHFDFKTHRISRINCLSISSSSIFIYSTDIKTGEETEWRSSRSSPWEYTEIIRQMFLQMIHNMFTWHCSPASDQCQIPNLKSYTS